MAEFEEVQGGAAGKGAKKGGKDEPASELIDKPFTDSRKILVKICKNDKVLYETVGINEVTIPNIKLESTKANPSIEYYLQAEFDMRVWPDCSVKKEETDKICWVAQISSTDSIAIVRDTKQEDKEKAIEWCRKAAYQGHEMAKGIINRMQQDGQIVF